MRDAKDLLQIIKQAAKDAVEASKPADFSFGKVTNESPLKILVEQKLLLGAAQLVLTRNVTDYETKIDDKKVTVNNALKVGDKVVLLRQKGGQKYLVIDRVVNSK